MCCNVSKRVKVTCATITPSGSNEGLSLLTGIYAWSMPENVKSRRQLLALVGILAVSRVVSRFGLRHLMRYITPHGLTSPMKLFKRSDDPLAPWYYRFQVRGKPILWCCKTHNRALAEKYAKQYREAVTAENYGLVSQMKARSTTATYKELFEVYWGLPEPRNLQTKRRNIGAMRTVLGVSKMAETDRMDRLSGQVGARYQQWSHEQGMSPASTNAVLRMCKSLFSERAMVSYRMHKLDVPVKQAEEFKAVLPLREPKKRPELPTPPALAMAIEHLPKQPQHWRAFLLAAAGGLRAGEIANARKSWLTGNTLTIGGTAEFTTKDQDWRTVELDPEVAAILRAGEGEFIVGDRALWVVTRELVPMLKGYGFPAKPLQSLRRLAGSMVAAANGSMKTRDFLGHSSVQTSERFYVNVQDRATAIPLSRFTPVNPSSSVPLTLEAGSAVCQPAFGGPVQELPRQGQQYTAGA